MKLILSIVLISIGNAACAQMAKQQTDWEKEKLKGKVKLIRTTAYTFALPGDTEHGFDNDNYTVDSFNSKGMRQKFYYMNKGQIISYTIYKYNAKGLLVEDISFSKDTTRNVHKYDARGNEIEQIHYDAKKKPGDKMLMKYDARNNNTEMEMLGSYPMKMVSKFDNKNRTTEMITYHGNKFGSRDVFRYDEAGRTLGYDVYNEDGKLRSKAVYVDDSHGNTVAFTHYNADGKQTGKTIYEYTYDSHGNWTVLRNTPDGKPLAADFRQIEYYE